MTALFVAAGATLLALACLALSRLFHALPRLRLIRIGIYVGVPSLSATLVLTPLQLHASFADALSVAGLGVSLIFGMGAKALDVVSLRLRVGVVIPSRAPFHAEVRRGLAEGMVSVRAVIHDEYLRNHRAPENLAAFVPCLRKTLATQPDYLVVACPSFEVLGREEIMKGLKRFQRRGGQLIFIDNAPEDPARAELRAYGLVRADVERAAHLVSDWIAQRSTCAKVLVVSGPKTSDPALRYRRALESRSQIGSLAVIDTLGWSEASAYIAVEGLDSTHIPDFIVCGNDVMAFGAVRALRQKLESDDAWRRCSVIGYNGISRALFAISEPANPLRATVCIPPATYGEEIAAMILHDASRWVGRSRLEEVCIPLSEGQLVDASNIDLILED